MNIPKPAVELAASLIAAVAVPLIFEGTSAVIKTVKNLKDQPRKIRRAARFSKLDEDEIIIATVID